MKESEIFSVSEAFSMQPSCWTIGYRFYTGNDLSKIIIESVYDTGDPYDFYVGYDTTGKKVFQIRVMAATVQYR